MTDSLTVFGTDFTGVTGIKATGTGNGTLTYIRPQGTKSISANGTGIDVAAYASVDVSVSSDDFVVTLSYNDQTEMWEPDCTIYEFQDAYDGGKRIVLYGDGCAPAGWYYDDDYMFMYAIYFGGNNEMNLQEYWWTLEGIEAVGSNTFIFPNFESVTRTYTPTTSQQTDTVTYNSGLDYNGLQQVAVTVNAMPSGSATAPATISGTAATVSTGNNTLTLSKTVSVTPSVTAGYVSSGTAGNSSVSLTANVTTQAAQTIYPSTTDQSIAASRYLTGAQTIKGVAVANLTAANVKQGVTVTIGDSSDADRIMSVTGTYSGGSSKNVQVAQSTTRVANTAYTKAASLTCSVTGKYDVYWDCFRSSTSGTNGSQLYIGGSAYGTANTTFSNSIHVQNNHLTNVSISADQEVAVYVRSRATNYYAYCGQLTIVQTA